MKIENTRATVGCVLVLLLANGLTACGSSSKAPGTASATDAAAQTTSTPAKGASIDAAPLRGDAIARVGTSTITNAMLGKWMPALAGGDFYEIANVIAPNGIVTEPANYAKCALGLKAIAKGNAAKLQRGELEGTCRQLHRALREQALSYLITSVWSEGFDAEAGVHLTGAEVQQEFARLKAESFPLEGQLREYLAQRRWPLSVELFLVRRDLLSKKLQQKLTATGGKQSFDRYISQAEQRWAAKTTCRTGDMVEQCRGYAAAKASPAPPPATLIAQITGR